MLGGQNGVSRALLHPEIASDSNFYLESHFGLFLLQRALLTSLTWCSHNLSVLTLTCLSTDNLLLSFYNMSDLPVGWGNRLNAATEETSTREGRPGDWRANKMKSGTSLIEDNQLASDIPFGFGDRNNSKSLEEVS